MPLCEHNLRWQSLKAGFLLITDTRKTALPKKVYHLHLRYRGDNDELYFKEYLNDHPGIAKEYEQLNIDLWHQY